MSLDYLTNYQATERESIFEVRTDEVTPISTFTSDRRYIFRLEPQGVLDTNTLLQFKLVKSASAAAGDTNLRVNSFNGALGAVKRVIFRIGDFTLNDTDDVNMWSSITQLSHRRREELNRYESFYLGNQFHTQIDAADDTTNGQVSIDNTNSGYNFSTRTQNSLHLLTTEDDCYKYGIPLGMLIPALKGREIPLWMFNQYRIVIEVEFHPPSAYLNARNASVGCAVATDTACDIVDVELLVDYIIYPSSVIEAQRQETMKEGGLLFDFFNVVMVERQLAVTSAGDVSLAADTGTVVNSAADLATLGPVQSTQTAQEYRIGQENREIHQIFMVKQKQGKTSTSLGPVSTINRTGNGTGYTAATVYPAFGGSGNGLFISVTTVGGGGAITAEAVSEGGNGYAVNDTVTLKGGNNNATFIITAIGPNNSASLLLDQRIDGLAYESIQWNLNGVDVYPEPKDNTNSLYDQMYYALGYRDLNVERPMYYTDANSILAGLTAWNSSLQGTYKPIGYDARVSQGSIVAGAGTLINKYPIVLKYKCNPALTLNKFGANDTGNKTSVDQSGQYNVDFFISTSRRAIVKTRPDGAMTVQVSY